MSFEAIADRCAKAAGSKWAFILAVSLVVIWAAFGPYFHWSDTHQLLINTTTTIITFWVVFLLQNTTNRESRALHIKLDELIKVQAEARNELIGLEKQPEAVIEALSSQA